MTRRKPPKNPKKNPVRETTTAKQLREQRERDERRAELAGMFERWLRDKAPCTICVFENHDFGSMDLGRRIAMPADTEQAGQMVLGTTRAPDSKFGFGWRYLLVAKCHTVQEALAAMLDKKGEPATT